MRHTSLLIFWRENSAAHARAENVTQLAKKSRKTASPPSQQETSGVSKIFKDLKNSTQNFRAGRIFNKCTEIFEALFEMVIKLDLKHI